MSKLRVLSVNVLIGVLACASLLCVALQTEYWPFSNYPMYAGLAPPSTQLYRVVGVVDGDPPVEVPLPSPNESGIFVGSRFRRGLGLLVAQSDRGALDDLLRAMARRYEERRRSDAGLPTLLAVRVYKDRWETAPDEELPLRKVGHDLVAEIAPGPGGGW